MSESGMRERVVRMLSPVGGIAVENPALPGTPDVNYTLGWVELKWLRSWPVGEATPVVIDHFTPQQRIWHINRRRCGGRSHVLIQCRREWVLLDGIDAALHLNQVDRSALIKLATWYWNGGLNQKELLACLLSEPRPVTLDGEDGETLRQLLAKGTV